MSEEFFKDICDNNYLPHEDYREFSIGYNKLGSVILIFPSLALLLNSISVINYIRERKTPK